MAFHVGQRVVCVKDNDFWAHGNYKATSGYPIKGHTYIIDAIENYHCACNCSYLILKELSPDDSFFSKCFRPLAERKTDISIFKSLLNPARKKELVDS